MFNTLRLFVVVWVVDFHPLSRRRFACSLLTWQSESRHQSESGCLAPSISPTTTRRLTPVPQKRSMSAIKLSMLDQLDRVRLGSPISQQSRLLLSAPDNNPRLNGILRSLPRFHHTTIAHGQTLVTWIMSRILLVCHRSRDEQQGYILPTCYGCAYLTKSTG